MANRKNMKMKTHIAGIGICGADDGCPAGAGICDTAGKVDVDTAAVPLERNDVDAGNAAEGMEETEAADEAGGLRLSSMHGCKREKCNQSGKEYMH
jgi:hypothetical protein